MANFQETSGWVQYVASASMNTTFPFDFVISQKEEVYVLVNGIGVIPQSVTYNSNGGEVTLTPVAVGSIVTLYRDFIVRRVTSFSNEGLLTNKILNSEFDNIIRIEQQNQENFKRTLAFAKDVELGTFTTDVPKPEANKALVLDDNKKFKWSTYATPEILDDKVAEAAEQVRLAVIARQGAEAAEQGAEDQVEIAKLYKNQAAAYAQQTGNDASVTSANVITTNQNVAATLGYKNEAENSASKAKISETNSSNSASNSTVSANSSSTAKNQAEQARDAAASLAQETSVYRDEALVAAQEAQQSKVTNVNFANDTRNLTITLNDGTTFVVNVPAEATSEPYVYPTAFFQRGNDLVISLSDGSELSLTLPTQQVQLKELLYSGNAQEVQIPTVNDGDILHVLVGNTPDKTMATQSMTATFIHKSGFLAGIQTDGESGLIKYDPTTKTVYANPSQTHNMWRDDNYEGQILYSRYIYEVTRPRAAVTLNGFGSGGAGEKDGVVTNGVLVGTKLYLSRSEGLPSVEIEMDSLRDGVVESATLNSSHQLVIQRSGGLPALNVDLSSLVEKDGVVTGGTISNSSLILTRSEGLPNITIDLSSIVQPDKYVTNATLNSVTKVLTLSRSAGLPQLNVDFSSVIPTVGTAATKDVGTQTGNVMEVGAFGIGASNLDFVTNLNEVNVTSFVACDGRTSNTPSGDVVGHCATYISTSGRTQTFHSLNSGKVYVRRFASGGWQAWVEVITDSNFSDKFRGKVKYGTSATPPAGVEGDIYFQYS